MPSEWKRIAPFALISLVCFLLGLGILFSMPGLPPQLQMQFYYVSLLAFGLAVALVLFGVMRSYASYSGRRFGGTLRLSGPVVGFLLVIVLSRTIPHPGQDLAVTVYVHGAGGPTDAILRSSGYVLLYCGAHPERQAINENGMAKFVLPPACNGQDVPVSLIDEQGAPLKRFEIVSDHRSIKIAPDTVVYVPIRRVDLRIAGTVRDVDDRPIDGATVKVAGLSIAAGPPDGEFELVIPGERLTDDLELLVSAPGHATKRFGVVADSHPMQVVLLKRE